MNKIIKVLAVTGIRSEYDILFPVLSELENNQCFDLSVVVSGAHLSDWHGNTLNKIEEDCFKVVDRLDSLFMTSRTTQRAKGLGILTYSLAQTVERINPDFLLVLGDREESMATALVGNYMNILVAHIAGGDPVYGNADDPVRFAVSKLSHIHFAFAKEYAKNLKKIGEDSFRIFNVGNPSLYNVYNTSKISINVLKKYLKNDIKKEKYIVLIKHSLSSEKEKAYKQMEITLKAMSIFYEKTGVKVIGIAPNTDPGSFDIGIAIENYENSEGISFYQTLPREIFVNLLRNTLALSGNSSMGFLEALAYKLPVVNIGNRQRGRLNPGNVEFVDYDINNIVSSLEKACFDKKYRSYIKGLENPFGEGDSPSKIVNILKGISLGESKWYVKKKLC